MTEENVFSRTAALYGDDALRRLASATVAVFGIGGVGGYVVEALARSGVGRLVLVDSDTVDVTNINRQIIATTSTVGRPKVEVMKERVLDINPAATVDAHQCFFLPENADSFYFGAYSYAVDAVDTVSAKLAIIERARAAGVPVISAMGAGNKTDPTKFRVADIYETSVCPLARVMRRECRKRGIERLTVVYSTEEPARAPRLREAGFTGDAPEFQTASATGTAAELQAVRGAKPVPASVAFVPSVAGLLMASVVVNELVGKGKQ